MKRKDIEALLALADYVDQDLSGPGGLVGMPDSIRATWRLRVLRIRKLAARATRRRDAHRKSADRRSRS